MLPLLYEIEMSLDSETKGTAYWQVKLVSSFLSQTWRQPDTMLQKGFLPPPLTFAQCPAPCDVIQNGSCQNCVSHQILFLQN